MGGSEIFAIGHEASYAQSEDGNGGQCASNPKVGEWYSMPAGGQCQPPNNVSEKCTWRIVKRVKTVTMPCVFGTHNMFAACKKARKPPYLQAESIFAAAFASSDLKEGGCPDIPPNSTIDFL